MRCPTLSELPPPPAGKTGWPWTEESPQLPDTMPDGRPWPRVSIVTPSYNQAQFIEEAIRSVLLQGYPDLEYIIIDGGSIDGSVDIICKYGPWLAYWVSEPDRGQADAINKGWQRATGQYVTWLNSDDFLLPLSLKQAVSALTNDDAFALVYGDVLVVDAYSKPYAEPYHRVRGQPFNLEDMILRWRNPVPQQGFLMRRSLLDQVGYLDEHFHFTMDFEYWVRIALTGGRGRYIPHVLAAFRSHRAAKSSSIQLHRISDRYAIYQKVFSCNTPPQIKVKAKSSKAAFYLDAAYIAYTAGKAGSMRHYAVQHILQAGLKSSPWAWLFLIMSFAGDQGVSIMRRFWRALRSAWTKYGNQSVV